MSERCPCCNARLREPEQCSRCKADLKLLVDSEKSAALLFSQALGYWLENKTEQSVAALEFSLGLKENKLAVVFRQYMVKKKYLAILDLLAQKQLIMAKKQLYSVRMLLPYSTELRHLNQFADYLLVKSQ